MIRWLGVKSLLGVREVRMWQWEWSACTGRPLWTQIQARDLRRDMIFRKSILRTSFPGKFSVFDC